MYYILYIWQKTKYVTNQNEDTKECFKSGNFEEIEKEQRKWKITSVILIACHVISVCMLIRFHFFLMSFDCYLTVFIHLNET